uniref:SF-assemblin/beta giardin n=1 Tax=Marseillevirus LCMAC101 TaxID=2506602 RepID=A0A481YRC7_9VIRU|nr:MAG: SF-assemblin/beta giardin [Marseillevirus LCMAC101]
MYKKENQSKKRCPAAELGLDFGEFLPPPPHRIDSPALKVDKNSENEIETRTFGFEPHQIEMRYPKEPAEPTQPFVISDVRAEHSVLADVGKTIMESLRNILPITPKEKVEKELMNITQMYENNHLTDYECIKLTTIAIMDDRIPAEFKMKFLPLCINTINEQLAKQGEYTNKMLQLDGMVEPLKTNVQELNRMFENSVKELNKISSNIESVAADTGVTLKKDINDCFDRIDKHINQTVENCNRIEYLANVNVEGIKEIQNNNDKMVKYWANEDKARFRCDQKISDFRNQMESSTDSAEIRNLAIKIKNRQVEIIYRKEEFEQTVNTYESIFQGGALIVNFFGNKQTARKIALVSNAGFTITKHIAGLAGCGMMLTNPITATVAIMGCVSSLIDGFSNNNDNGLSEVFDQLFEQLNIIRQEMHERFDNLDKKIDHLFDVTLTGLTNIQRSQDFTNREIMLLNKKVDSMDTYMKYYFVNIEHQIKKLFQAIKTSKHNKVLELLTHQLYTYINEDLPDPDQYVSRVKSLEAHINLTSTKYTDGTFPETLYNQSPTDYDFCINHMLKLLDRKPDACNQTIYVITALSVVFLTIRQYQNACAPPLSRITTHDIKRLDKILSMGIQLKDTILYLGDEVKLKDLIRSYRKILIKCKEGIEKFKKGYESKISGDYNRNSYETHISKYNNVSDIDLFKKPFSVTTNPKGGNWYQNTYWQHWNKNGYAGQFNSQRGEVYPTMNSIKKQTSDGIASAKQKYIDDRKLSTKGIYANIFYNITVNPKYQPLREDTFECADFELPWVIHPEKGNDHPVLPVPKTFNRFISNVTKELCCMNMGYLKFTYTIDENTFRISFNLITNSQVIDIGRIVLEYVPGIYEGMEAIWWYWVGGNYCNQKIAPQVCVHNARCCGGHDYDLLKVYTSVPVLQYHKGIMENFDNIGVTFVFMRSNNLVLYPVSPSENIDDDESDFPFADHLWSILRIANKESKNTSLQFKKQLEVWIRESKLIRELDSSSKLIMTYINTILRDITSDENSKLYLFLANETPLVDSTTIIDKINSKDVSNVLDLPFWTKEITDKLLELYHSYDGSFHNITLEFTIEIIDKVMDHYKNSVVEFNRWYRPVKTGEVMDSMFKETKTTLLDILNLAFKKDNIKSVEIIEKMTKLKRRLVEMTDELDDDVKIYTAESLRVLCGDNKTLLQDL